jgi:cyclase
MTRQSATSFILLLSVGTLVSSAEISVAARRPSVAPAPVPALTYRLQEVAGGVFCAIATGVPYYVANSVVVLGQDGVLVVDSGAGPNEARVLLAAIRRISDQPVRWVIDTHFHFDHAFGNEAFPDASIVAHEATRELLGRDGLTLSGYVAGLPAQIEKARRDSAPSAAALEAYQKELAALVPTGPDLTFSERLTLWLGGREVRLLHLGRGHTAGDVVVHLPQERVVCTGDLFNGYIGYMGDAYVDEWADTLERLAALDFETVVPGHGTPFKGKDAIAPVQACLRDLWRQAASFKRDGVSAADAARRIDLRAHGGRFPRLAQVGFEPVAVRRIYEVIDERAPAAITR